MDTETYMLKLKFEKNDAVRIMELLHAAREAANEEPRAGWRERYLLEIIDGDLKRESEDESNLSYRKATLLDVAKILALSDIYLDKDVLITRQYLINNIARGNIWIVFDGCKLVAFSISGFKRKSVLWNLYVHPEYRNRGIGRSLIEKINPEIIRVKSDQSTGDPTGYYKKMGYTVTETMQGKKRNITVMKHNKENERE